MTDQSCPGGKVRSGPCTSSQDALKGNSRCLHQSSIAACGSILHKAKNDVGVYSICALCRITDRSIVLSAGELTALFVTETSP